MRFDKKNKKFEKMFKKVYDNIDFRNCKIDKEDDEREKNVENAKKVFRRIYQKDLLFTGKMIHQAPLFDMKFHETQPFEALRSILPKGMYLCGGSLAGMTDDSDFDLFIVSPSEKEHSRIRDEFFLNYREKVGRIPKLKVTNDLIEFISKSNYWGIKGILRAKVRIQIIRSRFESLQQILMNFDIYPCQKAMSCDGYFETFGSKASNFLGFFPIFWRKMSTTCLKRIKKYQNKNYAVIWPELDYDKNKNDYLRWLDDDFDEDCPLLKGPDYNTTYMAWNYCGEQERYFIINFYPEIPLSENNCCESVDIFSNPETNLKNLFDSVSNEAACIPHILSYLFHENLITSEELIQNVGNVCLENDKFEKYKGLYMKSMNEMVQRRVRDLRKVQPLKEYTEWNNSVSNVLKDPYLLYQDENEKPYEINEVEDLRGKVFHFVACAKKFSLMTKMRIPKVMVKYIVSKLFEMI